MTPDEITAILTAHAAHLRGEGGTRAYLSGAYLSDAYLSGAYLSGADLSDADLSGAYLSGANLSGANLSGANLSRAYLSGANLSGADLRRANLSDANLSRADLSGANLRGASLRGATLDDATVLPTGETWQEYRTSVVPALLTAGGRSVERIVAAGAWDCHEWTNCPMASAFNVQSLTDVPLLLRPRVEQFVQLFDAGLIPCPEIAPESAEAEAEAGA